MERVRKIIHIDMDAFFASVEQLDNPELREKAIAVGGGEKRGVVATASYEARKYGVKSAMNGYMARKLCPHIIFVRPRFERYKEISLKIREIFHEYTDLVEPMSIDEAYLDVTENKKGISSASRIAREIREKIFSEIGITASAGISVNKFVAKIASDYNKPNGQTTIVPEDILGFLDKLEVRKFYGIGKVTAERMNRLGIFTGKDLRDKSLLFLEKEFGNMGDHFYNICRGIHNSAVNPIRIEKSVGVERTFESNLVSFEMMKGELEGIAKELERRLKRKGLSGRTVTLKVKYGDFVSITRSKTMRNFVSEGKEIVEIGVELLENEKIEREVRLLGLSVSNLNIWEEESEYVQLKIDFGEW